MLKNNKWDKIKQKTYDSISDDDEIYHEYEAYSDEEAVERKHSTEEDKKTTSNVVVNSQDNAAIESDVKQIPKSKFRTTFVRKEDEQPTDTQEGIDHQGRLTKGDLARLDSQRRGQIKENVGQYTESLSSKRLALNNHKQRLFHQ
jgi:hypothetical protein